MERRMTEGRTEEYNYFVWVLGLNCVSELLEYKYKQLIYSADNYPTSFFVGVFALSNSHCRGSDYRAKMIYSYVCVCVWYTNQCKR